MKFEIQSGFRGTSKDIILERLLFTSLEVDRIKEKYLALNKYSIESVKHYPYYQTNVNKHTPLTQSQWVNKILTKLYGTERSETKLVKQSTLGHSPLQRDLTYHAEDSFLENLNFLNILDNLRESIHVVDRISSDGFSDIYKDTFDEFRLQLFLYGLILKGEYNLERAENNHYRLFDLLGLDSSDICILFGDKNIRTLRLIFKKIKDNVASVVFKLGDETQLVNLIFNIENTYEKALLETLKDKFMFKLRDKHVFIHADFRKYYLGTSNPSKYLSFIKKDNVLYVKTVTEDSTLTYSFKLGEFRIESAGYKGVFPITKIIPTINPEEAIELYCNPSEIPL